MRLKVIGSCCSSFCIERVVDAILHVQSIARNPGADRYVLKVLY